MIVYTPINQTGYGIASLNILKALYQKNNDIAYFPIGNPSIDNQEDYNFIQKIYNNSITADFSQPCIKIWHQFDLALRIGKGTYYAYPFFELDKLNKLEQKHMNVPDHLFVSSQWSKQIVENNNIKTPTTVVPLGVDLNIFNINRYKKQNNNKYIFANIGKWEIRKGHDFLYQTFLETFPEEKDVELWVLASESTNNYSSKEDLIAWKKLYSQDPRIKLFSGFNTHQEIANFIAQIDCGVFPSRAEGWNLELLECMAMNKPVIATNYSAHTEFCNSENCFLVNINDIELAHDGKAFNGQGNWAKIGQDQINQIKQYMRYVYDNKINTNSAGLKTAQEYSWQNSAECIYRCINR